MAGQGGDDAALVAAQERVTGIVARLRDVMSALHPTMLQYGGLEAALLAVVEQERGTGQFEAHVVVDPAAAGHRDELLLSLARELLANASRHASASRVHVGVQCQDGEIMLRVSDDGSGYAPGRLAQALAAGAIGIASCRERVEAVGGRLEIHSAPGAGTHATAHIPAGAEALDPGQAATSRLDAGADRA
jgi:two-component system NarL family sensor kinase